MSLRPLRRVNRPDTRITVTIFIILAGLVILAAILSRGIFLQPNNLLNLVYQNVILGVVAVGQFFVVLTGGIDLSVGSIVGLSSVLLVLTQGLGLGGSVAVTFGVAALLGLTTGVMVSNQRLPSFVVTLAMMQIAYSLAQIVSGGAAVYTGKDGAEIAPALQALNRYPILGVPAPAAIWLAVLVGAGLYLRTRTGHFTYPTGGNERAAFLAGLPVNRVKVMAYVISALLAALGGVLFVGRVGMGDPQAGTWYLLDSIAAVSIGGASLSGGLGSIGGTLMGVLMLGTLNNITNLLNVSPTLQPAVKGAVILLAVYLNSRRDRP